MTTCRIYTVAEDTLDPDDPIFPRAATRIGTKFQCVVEDELNESGTLVPKSTTGEQLPDLIHQSNISPGSKRELTNTRFISALI